MLYISKVSTKQISSYMYNYCDHINTLHSSASYIPYTDQMWHDRVHDKDSPQTLSISKDIKGYLFHLPPSSYYNSLQNVAINSWYTASYSDPKGIFIIYILKGDHTINMQHSVWLVLNCWNEHKLTRITINQYTIECQPSSSHSYS